MLARVHKVAALLWPPVSESANARHWLPARHHCPSAWKATPCLGWGRRSFARLSRPGVPAGALYQLVRTDADVEVAPRFRDCCASSTLDTASDDGAEIA